MQNRKNILRSGMKFADVVKTRVDIVDYKYCFAIYVKLIKN